MPQILEGIKVVDMSMWAFGPASAAILGDWGADIIHVEPVEGGDPMRGIMSSGLQPICEVNHLWELDNRNKRSLALNVKTEKGMDILLRLVERADVFLTNYRPGVLRRLEVTYEDLSKANPRIIYAYACGYGEKGEEVDRGTYDAGAFWARSGIMYSLGAPEEPPPSQRPGMGDQSSALCLAGGIAAALLARERFGIGQKVSLSLLGGGLWMGSLQVQCVLLGGQNIPRLSRRQIGNPLFAPYQCKDNKWILLTNLQSDRYWAGFCKAVDRSNLEHHPKFNSNELRFKNHEELISILEEILATRTQAEWGKLFDENGVLWSPVQDYNDVVKDPMVLGNDYIAEVEHPERGKEKHLLSPIFFQKTPPSIRRVAPTLGQHDEEILLEMGYNWDEIVQLKDEGVVI